MTKDDVLDHLAEHVSRFTPEGTPERLPEGNLNEVWRVEGTPEPVIVKHAPPHVAANPDIPLTSERLVIEHRCLQALGPEGALEACASDAARAPRPLHVSTDPYVLVMEDCGALPTLGRWWRGEGPYDAVPSEDRSQAAGRSLGAFIGRLHAATHKDLDVAERFRNQPVQATRRAVQYQPAADMLDEAGVDDADALGARAVALGERFLEPGICLTMGDLWPPSVLVGAVAEDSAAPSAPPLRVIDWELAHFGRPAQDLAHLLAHYWMQAHRAPSDAVRAAVEAHRTGFLAGYQEGVETEGLTYDTLVTPQTRLDSAVHFAAEILVRTVGPFQEGYLYDGCAPDDEAVQTAVAAAAAALRRPEAAELGL
jgi:aminoglycoside phosphotransferase (APT) family kinase protein